MGRDTSFKNKIGAMGLCLTCNLVAHNWAQAASPHIENFELSQCYINKKCLKIKTAIAFVSQSSETLSAADGDLQIFEDAESLSPSTTYQCHSLTIKLSRLSVLCDNREIKNRASVFIDPSFKISILK